jgi:hypothetical protein
MYSFSGKCENSENTSTGTRRLYWILTVPAFAVNSREYFTFLIFFCTGQELTMRLRVASFAAILRQDMGWLDSTENSTGQAHSNDLRFNKSPPFQNQCFIYILNMVWRNNQ